MIRLGPNLNSITTRLIIFGVTLLLLGATGRVLVLGQYLRGTLTETSSARLETLATYAAGDIARQLELRKTLLNRLAERAPAQLLPDATELQNSLLEWSTINPLFSGGLVLLSARGFPLADVATKGANLYTLWAQAHYRQADQPGKIIIGTPFVHPYTGTPLLPMTTALFDANGRIQAYLVGLSALDSTDLLAGFSLSLRDLEQDRANGLILISPRDDLTLGSNLDGFSLTPLSEAGLAGTKQAPLNDAAPLRRSAETGSNGSLDLSVPVPGSDWLLIARLPDAEVYRPLTELKRFIFHNTGILVIIVLVVVTAGVRYFLGPLRRAAEHADKMTREEIPLAPFPIVRNDEVGHLTQAFNRVLDKLLDSREELQHLAHRDPLTGLPNRHLLADRMTQAIARAQRHQSWVAVLFLDLDRFKPINDRLGHDAGDLALQLVAARLQGALRRVDTLARVGGDEFVILLTDLGPDANQVVQIVAQKCLDTFEQEFNIKGEPCQLGTSIGVAIGDGEDVPDKLLIAADKAMYQSKLSGRGEIHWSAADTGVTESQQAAAT